jgi:hypothetical protein
LTLVTGVGSIVFNWLSCIHEYHKLKKKTKDRSANVPLLLFIILFEACVKTSDFPDLYADRSLSRSCEAAIPRLYTDVAETLFRPLKPFLVEGMADNQDPGHSM